MADNCAVAVGGIKLDPACDALKSPGGVKKKVYTLSISEIEGFTFSATEGLTGIVLKDGAKAGFLSGAKFKNSAGSELARNEFFNVYNQSVNFTGFVSTQPEVENLEKLADAEDIVIFAPENSGRMRVYGLVGKNGAMAEGLSMTSGAENTNVALADGQPIPLVFSGELTKRAPFVAFGATEADNIIYLDNLVATGDGATPAPVIP